MLFFYKTLTLELNLTDKIRFEIPFNYEKSWICYLNPKKDTHINWPSGEISRSLDLY